MDAMQRDACQHDLRLSRASMGWTTAKKAAIVTMSSGFADEEANNAKLRQTIGGHKDIVFMAAAGNGGSQIRIFPADCDAVNVISVTVAEPYGRL